MSLALETETMRDYRSNVPNVSITVLYSQYGNGKIKIDLWTGITKEGGGWDHLTSNTGTNFISYIKPTTRKSKNVTFFNVNIFYISTELLGK